MSKILVEFFYADDSESNRQEVYDFTDLPFNEGICEIIRDPEFHQMSWSIDMHQIKIKRMRMTY